MKKIIYLTLAFFALSVLMALPVSAQDNVMPIDVYEDTTLVLDNEVYRGNNPAIAVHNDAKLTIVLKGKSVIEHEKSQDDGLYSGIFLNDNSKLEIVNDPGSNEKGSLELKNWDFGISSATDNNGSSIQVEGVSLIIDSTMGGICNMNGLVDNISIRNAEVSVKNTKLVGIGSYFGGNLNNIFIDNSNVSVDSGFVGIGSDQASVENISIKNSKLNIKSKLVGIGGREADISKITISNNIGNIMVSDESDMPFVGIGMATGVSSGLSGNGVVRVYTMDELALKDNFLLVDSPVTCIGAARKILPNGETGTSIKNLNIEGGFMFMRTSNENGVCIGARDLNIGNINIQNANLTTMAKDTVLGCVENVPTQVNKPTTINIGGQTKMIALGNKTFVPERNTLHVADTAVLTSDVTPLNEIQMNDAGVDFQNALNAMEKPDKDFSGSIEELEEMIVDGQHTNLELLLSFINDNMTAVPDTPEEPDNTPEEPDSTPDSSIKPDNTPDSSVKPDKVPGVSVKPDSTPDVSVKPDNTPDSMINNDDIPDSPKTGDQSNLLLLAAITAISLATLIILSKKKKFN